MKTYNEIKEAISNIVSTIQPVGTKIHNMVHSDGLSQSHQEYIYDENIISLKKDIWNSNLTIKEKMELNDLLVSKMKI